MDSRVKKLIVLLGGALSLLAGFLGVVSTTGCYGDCVPCEFGEVGIWCRVGLQKHAICSGSKELAIAECDDSGGTAITAPTCPPPVGDGETSGGNESPDDETGGDETAGNEAWDPLGSVTYDTSSQTYIIDADFVHAVRADPNLMYLDGTSLVVNPKWGYYQVNATGDFSRAMGWEKGDVIEEINGYNLRGLDDVLAAYLAVESETEFILRITRGSRSIDLQYEVQ